MTELARQRCAEAFLAVMRRRHPDQAWSIVPEAEQVNEDDRKEADDD